MPGVTSHSRRIETRARAFERALLQWMLRVARKEASELARGQIRKQTDDEALIDILIRFGLSAAEDGAGVGASTRGLGRIIDPQALRTALRSREFRIKVFQEMRQGVEARARHISAETKKLVRESVQRILQDAADEEPRPSAGEIARRIRTQFHGDVDDRAYVFSPERASLIARTELAIAENTGIFSSYQAAGVKMIEWNAFTDGRSGDRRHDDLDGERVRVGEFFTTPLGNRMRYPGDPTAPVEDLANCRCVATAVIE